MENLTNLQDLGGYDMVISITQRTINTQLGALFRRNLIFPGKQIKESHNKSQLDVKVGAPVLSLEGNSPANQKIYMTIPFLGGEFTHGAEVPLDMEGRHVTFLCEVKIREVDQEYIRNHRNLEVEVKVKMASFDPNNFRISKLFIALKDRDQLHKHIDQGRSNLPEMSPEIFRAFADTLEKYLVGHIDHDHNPMLLGFMPTHKNVATEELSVLEKRYLVTGVRFSVTQNPEDGDFSLLNYMFMTQNREFPEGPGAGVISCDPEIKEPIYRVSHAAFAEGLIVEELRGTMETPKLNFATHPDPWRAMGDGGKKWTDTHAENGKQVDNSYEDQNRVTVTFSNASPPGIGDCGMVEVRDEIRRRVGYKFQNHSPGRNYSPLENIMMGSFRMWLTTANGKLVVHKGSLGRGTKDGDRTMEYYRWILDHGTPFDISHYKKVFEYFSSWIDGPPAFDKLRFKLAEDMVIPPTGGLFTMSKVRFALAVPGQSLINLCKTLAYKRPS